MPLSNLFASSKQISELDIKDWFEDGYLSLKSEQVLSAMPKNLAGMVDKLENQEDTPLKEMRYYETTVGGQQILNRIEKFTTVMDLMTYLEEAVRLRTLFPNCLESKVLFKDKINFKKAGGSGFEPHQDAQASWERYNHSIHITAMMAVDAANIENGCLEVVSNEQPWFDWQNGEADR